MPIYSFKVTRVVRTEAETNLVCENFQEALRHLAAMSRAGNLQWEGSPDGAGSHVMLRSISKDYVPVPGVPDATSGSVGWHGMFGEFDLDDLPRELLAIED